MSKRVRPAEETRERVRPQLPYPNRKFKPRVRSLDYTVEEMCNSDPYFLISYRGTAEGDRFSWALWKPIPSKDSLCASRACIAVSNGMFLTQKEAIADLTAFKALIVQAKLRNEK